MDVFRLLFTLALGVSAGCGSSWTSAPRETQQPIRYVQQPCTVPAIDVPEVEAVDCGGDKAGWACYNRFAALKLEHRLEQMRRWIDAARRGCVMEYDKSDYHLHPPYRRTSMVTQQPARLSAIPH
jgi:hypothetical protein